MTNTPHTLSAAQIGRLCPTSLDHRTHGPRMDAEFRRQARRHQAIVIDCSQISTLNSTGTGRLVSWLREAAIHNVHVGMTNVTPTLRAMFDLTSLSAVLPATVAAPQATQNRAA